jgi:hypothetical protein
MCSSQCSSTFRFVDATNNDTVAHTVTVYAVCSLVISGFLTGITTVTTAEIALDPEQEDSSVAQCPDGGANNYQVTGGGHSIG